MMTSPHEIRLSVAILSLLFFINSGLPSYALDDDNNPGKAPWRHAVRINAVSKHGLPVGKLTKAAKDNGAPQIRKLLKETPAHPGDEDERLFWSAIALYTEDRSEEAAELFKKVKTTEGLPGVPLAKIGRALVTDGQYDRALVVLNQAIATTPSPLAYLERAGCYACTKHLLEAAHDYESAAKLDQFSERTYLVRAASMLVKLGRYDEALKDLERAEKARGGAESSALWMVRADCFKSRKEWQKAIDALTVAEKHTLLGTTKFGSQEELFMPTILAERAKLYHQIGRYDLERKDLFKQKQLNDKVVDEVIGR